MEKKRKKGRVWKIIGLILGALIIALATITFIQVDFSNPKDLEKFVQVKMKKSGMTGVSIAIIKDNQIDRIINYGDADREKDIPITNDTVFQIASVSKTVTATAVIQLVEKGTIQLDDDINTFLPIRIVHPKFPDTPITFRMLLNHTSGIDNNWKLYDSLYTSNTGGGDSTVALAQFMKDFLVPGEKWYDEEKNFTKDKPGSAFSYSNVGYGLLGYLVEEISKIPFPDYTQQHIFDPVGMKHTKWLHKDLLSNNVLAVPYDAKHKPLMPYSFPTYPDGTLKTTTTEFAKFYLAIMNGGKAEKGTILSQTTLDEMFKPQSDNGNQALGWSYSALDSLYLKGVSKGKVIGHNGSDPGVLTITMFNPDNKSGLILFFNHELSLSLKSLNLHSMVKRLVKESGM